MTLSATLLEPGIVGAVNEAHSAQSDHRASM
jgi:hypothetical protein